MEHRNVPSKSIPPMSHTLHDECMTLHGAERLCVIFTIISPFFDTDWVRKNKIANPVQGKAKPILCEPIKAFLLTRRTTQQYDYGIRYTYFRLVRATFLQNHEFHRFVLIVVIVLLLTRMWQLLRLGHSSFAWEGWRCRRCPVHRPLGKFDLLFAAFAATEHEHRIGHLGELGHAGRACEAAAHLLLSRLEELQWWVVE